LIHLFRLALISSVGNQVSYQLLREVRAMSERTLMTLWGLGLTTAMPAAEPAPLFPFVLPWDDASPGITDLSGWLPKPARKFGPVRVGPDGHLYTGDRRLRPTGVDLACCTTRKAGSCCEPAKR
jgi:hypothetical protein